MHPHFTQECGIPPVQPDIALCTEDLHRIIEREVGNQLGGSDHRPVYLTIAAKTVSAPVLPRWNYKKANWLLYHHPHKCIDQKYSHLMIGISIKSLVNSPDVFYKQQKKPFQRGARKEYKPYWNNDLDKLHNELNTARDVAESEPTSENNTALKQVNAKFIRARNDARRKSWISKTADLNMEKDGKKLWRLTKQPQ